MKRREFLQFLSATGMVASLPLTVSKAQAAPPDHFYIMVNASGGWDPTSLIDPKGLNEAYPDRAGVFSNYDGSVNSVALDANKRIGDIQWSAIPDAFGDSENGLAERVRIEGQFDNLFQSYGSRMIVVNGIDVGTNNHATGSRNVWSGKLEMGHPNFAALYSASVAPSLPMSFISNGGYDETANLVAKSRANSAGYLTELADVNRRDNNNGYLYRTKDGDIDFYRTVTDAQSARIARQQSSESLPLRRQQLSKLLSVRSANSNLGAMSNFIDQLNLDLNRDTHMNNRSRSFKSQVQVATAAFASGLSASAILNHGGYDTHGNHDVSQYRSLGDLMEGLDYLMEALKLLNLESKTTIVIGSDFGRTPYYNSGRGKDHWNVTSMMTIMPSGVNTGGKVFGSSNAQFRAETVNPQTGQADNSGIVITPAHVQKALRKHAGIENSTTTVGFPLSVEDINLFS